MPVGIASVVCNSGRYSTAHKDKSQFHLTYYSSLNEWTNCFCSPVQGFIVALSGSIHIYQYNITPLSLP